MKSFIVAACIVACAFALNVDQDATVLRDEYQQSPDGSFQRSYETSNGISGRASGVLKPVGKDEVALTVEGSDTYTAPEGEVIQLTYTADEFGYHPVGDHLPTPPAPEPIPEYIARSIKYNAEHPYAENSKN